LPAAPLLLWSNNHDASAVFGLTRDFSSLDGDISMAGGPLFLAACAG